MSAQTANRASGFSPRARLLCFGMSAAVMALTPSVSYAQEATDEDSASENQAIIVTGSRLRTDGMEAPVPITALQAETLEAMAPDNLINGISQLPQFYGNQTPNSGGSWFTRGGYGNLDLRGMGINRTLTLLNGRRMISSTAFGGVDINAFPEAMISNVEVVTGGASAAYGTDAVAGVSNFIIDTNYTGLEVSLQGGISDRGDSENYEASFAFGTDIGDRGHFLLSGEIFEQDGVHNFEGRDWYKAYGLLPDGNGGQVLLPNVVSTYSSFDGTIWAPGTAIHGLQFAPDGSYAPVVVGSNAISAGPSFVQRSSGGSGDDLGAELQTLYPDVKRDAIFAYADYEVADGFTVFAQYIRGHNSTFRYNAPRGSFNGTPTTATIFQDNAFLPDALRQTMVDNEIDSFILRRMGSIEDIGANITLTDDSVMNSVTTGFKWDIDSGGFMDGWAIDTYYQYGHNRRKWNQVGMRVDRVFAALDAVDEGLYNDGVANGNIVCRVTLFSDAFPGCQPLNLFGRGNASAGAIDYVIGNDVGEQITTPLYFADSGYDLGLTDSYSALEAKQAITTLEQHVIDFTAAGDLFEGWAGTVSAAFGASYREESILQIVRDSTNKASDHDSGHPVLCNNQAPGLRGVSGPDCGNTVGVQYSKVSNIKGSSNVKEAFVEALVPLIADTDFMQFASLHLAGRVADYSGSGTVWAYKAGLDLEFSDSIRLRGTYSRDVRAANLSERFDKTGGTATITDPRYPDLGTVNVTRFSGGNPAVKPEKADTWTVGAILTPEFLPGFKMSVDYYDITIKGAIGQLGSQAVVNRCEDGATELCSLITRDATTDYLILVGDVFVNVDENKVRGIDLESSYSTDLKLFGGVETLDMRVFASWLMENSESLAGAAPIDRAGQTGIQQSDGVGYALPDFKLTGNLNYRNGPFGLFVQGRYIGSGTQENTLGNVAWNKVDSAFYTDLRLSYDLEIAGAEVELFGNVTNLFDKDPPITPYYSAFLAYGTQTNSTMFDLLGRRYTAGIKVKM